MRVVKSPKVLQRLVTEARQGRRRIALVPTMGYLHEGHLGLVHEARRRTGPDGLVVVSIYVNPTQFAPTEDLARYPRDFKRDAALCRAAGVDIIFAPEDLYPGKSTGGFSTYVEEENLSRGMEGVSRPTHFRGVTTVVAKLFNCALPDVAVFGAKDWQQAAIIRRMVENLDFPLKLVIAPTHREPDGLALSSRNKFLTPEQRAQATVLWRAQERVRKCVRQSGGRAVPAAELKAEVVAMVGRESAARLDYVEFFDPNTLQPVDSVVRGSHFALAVFFGATRLIDNGRM